MLAGKNLCIVGGSGFVGGAIAKKARALGANVTSVSRRGAPLTREEWQKSVEYVQADASDPNTFANTLEKADAVISTVGTLIDTSFTKGRQPGEPGTYEHLNRDTAIRVANKLEQFQKYKKMVYLSASGHPPFIYRYITTKEQAEEHLLGLNHVKSTILKPGFIYSFQDRWWSLAVRYDVDAWNYVHTYLMKTVPQNSLMKDVLKELYVDRSVLLHDVVNSALYSAFNKDTDGQRLFNQDIERISHKFQSL